ncbi:hypothetical protein DXA14_07330 [Hungatella hathewayi]|nr:hypothetical protein [Clostridiales bacterium AHG0011]RGZ05493.1 hypothetical protein DXA14_07330 [Hungatella hathewayi]
MQIWTSSQPKRAAKKHLAKRCRRLPVFGFGYKFEHIQSNTSGFTAQGQDCANFIPVFCQLFACWFFGGL